MDTWPDWSKQDCQQVWEVWSYLGTEEIGESLSMALINGTHTCVYCGKDFKWYYTIRENIESTHIFSVERIPKDASYVEIRYSNETEKQEL